MNVTALTQTTTVDRGTLTAVNRAAVDNTAVAKPATTDHLAPLARKSSFSANHPVLSGIGITYGSCSAAGAVGMFAGYQAGLAVERGAIKVAEGAFVQGPITGAMVGMAIAGTIGLIGGAIYSAHRAHH